jgi:alpha-D-ribose 1-methylphosphonate 5-triphosphate synthase subunit PhnH
MSHTGMDIALPGFADPIADAQGCFRAVLDAMARPGTLTRAGEGMTPPRPVDRATAAVLLTLVDHDTRLWVQPALHPACDWIAFHCGAGFTDAPAQAAFAVAMELPDLTKFAPGTHEQPELSTTLVVQVSSLRDGARYRLRGPGLPDVGALTVRGLPDDFADIWHYNHAGFPLGVDLILCAGITIAALPRSVMVEAI